jgi:hypothetical protein
MTHLRSSYHLSFVHQRKLRASAGFLEGSVHHRRHTRLGRFEAHAELIQLSGQFRQHAGESIRWPECRELRERLVELCACGVLSFVSCMQKGHLPRRFCYSFRSSEPSIGNRKPFTRIADGRKERVEVLNACQGRLDSRGLFRTCRKPFPQGAFYVS